jgi:hypothetical protein
LLRKLPRGGEFNQAVFTALDALSRRDIPRALQIAAELVRSREENAFYSVLFDRLTRENRPEALAHLATIPPGDAHESAVRAIASAWSRLDESAALAWAQQLPPSSDRPAAIETILAELSSRDPQRAIAIAQSSLSGPAFERTVYNALHQLTAIDPTAASRLVTLLPPSDMQTYAAVNVARGLANKNIETALAWIKSLPIELTQWIVLSNLLSSWAQKDLMAAARYVTEMPAGGALDYVAGHMATLLCKNPREAILWAEALPSTSAREAAFVMIASHWAQRQPSEALPWCLALTEEPLRTNALAGAFTYWSMIDAGAARSWLAQVNLPAATKAKLQSRDR